jgi:hypothetical protein
MKTHIFYGIMMLTAGAIVSAIDDIPFYGERKLIHSDEAKEVCCERRSDFYTLVKIQDLVAHRTHQGRELFCDGGSVPGIMYASLFESENMPALKMMQEEFGKALVTPEERATMLHAALYEGTEIAAQSAEEIIRTFGCAHKEAYGRTAVRMHLVLALANRYWDNHDIHIKTALLYWRPRENPTDAALDAYGCIHPLERVVNEKFST